PASNQKPLATYKRIHDPTLLGAGQKYFFDLAIFLDHDTAAGAPLPRRHPATLSKERAERAEASESAIETDRRHRNARFLEKKFRPLEPALLQILMRRLPKRRLKCSQ